MQLEISGLSPGGNETIIAHERVFDCVRVPISRYFIEEQSAGYVEQVGFLAADDFSPGKPVDLEMMGQELCIGGVRSAAALLFFLKNNPDPITVRCAGNDVVCENRTLKRDDVRRCMTKAILDIDPEIEQLHGATLVRLKGIVHLLVEVDQKQDLGDKTLDDHFRLMDEHAAYIEQDPAVGSIFYQKRGCAGGDGQPCKTYEINPFVRVNDTETDLHENGCGTGSVALIANVAAGAGKPESFSVLQPSEFTYSLDTIPDSDGSMTVSLDGEVTSPIYRQKWVVPAEKLKSEPA